jgi:hypothetical protein
MVIQARTIDISMGGLRLGNLSKPMENTVYDVTITTAGRGVIKLQAIPVHASEDIAGFKIVEIDKKDLQAIYHLIADFQSTEDFIKHIEEGNILHDWFIDEQGDKLNVIFETA